MEKLNIALLFGGRSSEHEVSLLSAKSVFDALDREKYTITLVEITQEGKWLRRQEDFFDEKAQNTPGESVMLPPESEGVLCFEGDNARCEKIDVIFPVLHGPYGEDGTMQGLLELANVPYVGAGVLGSAIGIDKDVMKRLLRDANIPIARFLVFRDYEKIDEEMVIEALGLPCFVKPAGAGSSVGVTKVSEKGELRKAIEEAFRYDQKILIEEAIVGREIECAVLGNENPKASRSGEVVLEADFYSYHEKYSSEQKTRIEIPAKIDTETEEALRNLAIHAYQVLECEGMGRVDFFVRGKEILVNEINTIPGFTSHSMYPKLWEATGKSYSDLMNALIELAIARHESRKKIQTAHEFYGSFDQKESEWNTISL